MGLDTLDSELAEPTIGIIFLTISMMVLLFAAILISGPVTGKYSWVNEKTKDLINQERILQEPRCVKVKMLETDEPAEPNIDKLQYDKAYYKVSLRGVAYFENGDSTKVALYFSRVEITEKKSEHHYFVKMTRF